LPHLDRLEKGESRKTKEIGILVTDAEFVQNRMDSILEDGADPDLGNPITQGFTLVADFPRWDIGFGQ
jgi:hypothetical protein